MTRPANDNLELIPGRNGQLVPLLGEIGAGGVVTFFDPDLAERLLAAAKPMLHLVDDDCPY